MENPTVWQEGRLIRRYKRFLADVKLTCGSELTIHCPNTGSMRHCAIPDTPCWFSKSDNPKRKYPHTWEVATTNTGALAGINTHKANGLVREAIEKGLIEPLQQYTKVQAEVRYGEENSRIDFLLSDDASQCFVEVKSVTLMESKGQGLFPDAVSSRGTKHLRELMAMVQQGHRAVLLFCVQHSQIQWVEPAVEIDPEYSKTLSEAVAMGVEVFAYAAKIEPQEGLIVLERELPVKIPAAL